MSTSFTINAYGATDCGLSRPCNEDAFLVDEALGLFIVADGVGGLAHGDVASKIAVEVVHQLVKEAAPYGLPDWNLILNKASEAVYTAGHTMGIPMGMGTTLTLLFMRNGHAHFAHVGDTGLFLFRKDEPPYQLTVDHTVGQELLDRSNPGDDLYIPEVYMHSLTRCIGQADPLSVDTGSLPLEVGERLLLISDGVVLAWEAEGLYEAAFEMDTPAAFVKRIIHEANAAGGHDNCTAIALFIELAVAIP